MNNIRLINQSINSFVSDIHCNQIIGEISETKVSGKHHYITLKNDDFIIKCISWGKSYEVSIGNVVNISGNLSFMKNSFTLYYKINNLSIHQSVGSVLSNYEITKNRLFEEGFISKKKSTLFFPYNIGLVTANNSAVIQDIMSVFMADNVLGTLYLKNTVMQGSNCPNSVIQSIEYFNNNNNVDVIIIFRGGGSKDDLEAFNNYEMMKCISESKIPTIGAIGHASDTSELINYVVDISKETPSLAGKYIIETQKKYIDKLNQIRKYIKKINDKYLIIKSRFLSIDTGILLANIDYKRLVGKMNIMKRKISCIMMKHETNKVLYNEKRIKLLPQIFKDNEQIITYDDFNKGCKKLMLKFFDGQTVSFYYQQKKMK